MEPIIHNTFVIERNYAAAPEKVFEAFADPAKKRRWYVEGGGHEVEQYDMDFRPGGRECARFHFAKDTGYPVAGMECVNVSNYEDIVPGRRIVFSNSMSIGGKFVSATLATVEFVPKGTGTDLVFTHQGVFTEGSGGAAMRERGWCTLFDRLMAALQGS
ncbi:MAG TPA: SRPBCC family protein [Bryobacteraceae bacterium]|jgi:uncharacterized protein YndB with AHSA1/START domain